MSDHEPQPVTIDAVAMAMIRESEKREKEQATKQRIKELEARVAELEAKLADSVTRDVAEDCAFLGLCCGSISTNNPYWAPEIVRAAALTVNPKNDPGWATSIFTEAVARAESEARE